MGSKAASLKKNLKSSRPSEHPPVRGGKCSLLLVIMSKYLYSFTAEKHKLTQWAKRQRSRGETSSATLQARVRVEVKISLREYLFSAHAGTMLMGLDVSFFLGAL